jgi:DNA-directed RNA polymerase subunit RPC12/RpoP
MIKMKVKNRKVNTCIMCGDEAGNFVWTTSRQINSGIRAMYPDGKLCQNCLKELQFVYPPVTRPDSDRMKCPYCGGKIKTHTVGLGNEAVEERYCEECGTVME